MLRGLGLTLSLLAGLVLAWMNTASPGAKGANAPAEAFSAGRAFADVEVMARAPHPIGTPANFAVRDHLLARMKALGLNPRVQRAPVFIQDPYDGGMWTGGAVVENVIGVLPGRDRSKPAIALMAHYDSAAGSPGAADDAAGVAAALEVARALKTGGQPARDVVLLITDGEEAGLLGARAFFGSDDPLVGHVGAVINLEARGGGGRAMMFQTGADNGPWVDLFRKTATAPSASSLTGALYKILPNDTDFTVSLAKGLPGLNFAFIGRQFDYHAPSSTSATLDKGSLQHLGDQALAASRATAFADALPGKAPDVVYSQTFGNLVIAYPVWAGWLVLAAAAGLLGVAIWRARGKEELDWPDLARGVGLAFYLLLTTGAVLNLARKATGSGFGWFPYRRLLASFGVWEATLVVLIFATVMIVGAAAAKGRARIVMAVFAAAAGGLASLIGGWDMAGAVMGGAAAVIALLIFGHPLERGSTWAGVMLTGLVAALAAQILMPTAAFLIMWPLLAGAGAAAVSALGGGQGVARVWPNMLRNLVAIVAIGWLGGYAHGLAQGLDMPAVLGLIAWLWALAAWPLAHSRDPDEGGVTKAVLMLLIGMALVGFLRLHQPWNARHPRPTQVAYLADRTDGTFWRVSLTQEPDDWTASVLGADVVKRRITPMASREVSAGKAGAVAVTPPQLSITRLADGRVEVRAAPAPGSRILMLDLKSTAGASGLTIDGKPAKGLEKAGDLLKLRWQAAPQGMVVSFRPAGPGQLSVDWAGVTERWPKDAPPLPARPKGAAPWETSDSTAVRGRSTFGW